MRNAVGLFALVLGLIVAGAAPSSAVEPFTCADVVDVKSSSPLRPKQAFGLGWTLPFETGYGFFQDNVWQDSGKTNDALEPMAILFLDEEVANPWRDRTISVWCADGRQLEIKLPQFQDIGGKGFVDVAGRQFPHGFWIGKDGRVYHDKELTQPVPGSGP